MKKFENTALWKLIRSAENLDDDSVIVDEETMLNELLSEVDGFWGEENCIARRVRLLQFARSELIFVSKKPTVSKKMNGQSSIIDRAIAMLDCELTLIDMDLEYHERFVVPLVPEEVPDFDLHFVGKSKDFGIVGLAEVLLTIFLTNEIVGSNGQPAPLIRLANAFEYFLDMNFGDIYKQVEAILVKRKPFNRTKALDYLRTLLLREEKRRLEEKKKKQDGK